MSGLKLSPDDPAQSQRFLDMAKEVGADGNAEAFEASVTAIGRHKPDREPAKRRKTDRKPAPPDAERGKMPLEDT